MAITVDILQDMQARNRQAGCAKAAPSWGRQGAADTATRGARPLACRADVPEAQV
jgi:hypothetical protein